MSKLQDIINKKLEDKYGRDYNLMMEEVPKPSPVQKELDENVVDNIYYTKAWLGRVVLAHRFAVSKDTERVDKILEALNRKKGQCPCGGIGAQYKCPCHIMRKTGICKCGLFESVKDRHISDVKSEGKING